MPVRLVEAEAERPGDARPAKEGNELPGRRGEAVDVGAAVDVRVEELGTSRNRPRKLVVVRRDQAVVLAPATPRTEDSRVARAQTRRRSAAQRLSSCRLESWSLRRTADTCDSTVFTEM